MPRVVPLVQCLGDVDALIALQPYEWGLQRSGKRLGGLGLADSWLTLDENRLAKSRCTKQRHDGAIVSEVVDTIERIRESANPRLEIHGILRTMFDPRNNLANEVSAQLEQHFGDRVYRTVIPRNIRLAEAPSFGCAALFHDKFSRGALAYLALAGEINRRESAAA